PLGYRYFGNLIATVTYISLVFASTSVCLRTIVRHKWMNARMKLDDWIMIVALANYLMFCADIIALTMLGTRHPVVTESVADLLLLLLGTGEALFMLTSIALKTSLVIFFRRFLFKRPQRHLVTWITALYCLLSAIGFFLGLLRCGVPVHMARKQIEGQCISTVWWNDWILTLLPILIIWQSSMPAKKKLGVTLLMVFAVCGSLCAVLRTIYAGSLHLDVACYDIQHHSTCYHTTALVINMAVLEMGIGITTSSVACLLPLFRRCATVSQRFFSCKIGMHKGGISTVLDDTSSRYWNTPNFLSTVIAPLEDVNIDLKIFGILPSVDLSRGEDSCEDFLNRYIP
ncbi:hypothetical protein D6D01_09821, partial [Aureobasidium pullulans]